MVRGSCGWHIFSRRPMAAQFLVSSNGLKLKSRSSAHLGGIRQRVRFTKLVNAMNDRTIL